MSFALFFWKQVAVGQFSGYMVGNFYGVTIGATVRRDIPGPIVNFVASLASYYVRRHNRFSGIWQMIFNQVAVIVQNATVVLIMRMTPASVTPENLIKPNLNLLCDIVHRVIDFQ